MRHLLVFALVAVVGGGGLAACHPRLSMGYDMSAHTRGPLANLQTIPRLTAVTGLAAPPPPEGRNYSAGIAFGDKRLTIGVRMHAHNISGSTLDVKYGPQYMTGAAALDCRYRAIHTKYISAVAMIAPSYTMLLDSTRGERTWGDGLRYGGGLELHLSMFSVYADVYQEILAFRGGPALGESYRNGVTIGLAFRP